MLDMDRGIAAEEKIDFVRGYSKRDRGLVMLAVSI